MLTLLEHVSPLSMLCGDGERIVHFIVFANAVDVSSSGYHISSRAVSTSMIAVLTETFLLRFSARFRNNGNLMMNSRVRAATWLFSSIHIHLPSFSCLCPRGFTLTARIVGLACTVSACLSATANGTVSIQHNCKESLHSPYLFFKIYGSRQTAFLRSIVYADRRKRRQRKRQPGRPARTGHIIIIESANHNKVVQVLVHPNCNRTYGSYPVVPSRLQPHCFGNSITTFPVVRPFWKHLNRQRLRQHL